MSALAYLKEGDNVKRYSLELTEMVNGNKI